jgi:predicted RNA-binding Zn-ribbon protein involved in translation (DUF1610 family)
MGLLHDMRDVLWAATHKKPLKKYCPQCGNPDIRLSSQMDYWLTPTRYKCDKFGYRGPVFMELEKEEE